MSWVTKRSGADAGDGGVRGEHVAAVAHKAISSVQLDGQVVLRITTHCRDNYVMGSLLGLDVDETLEVTNCFPIPTTVGAADADGDDDVVTSEYQMDMMKALRDVNIDYNQVGWYTSAYLGSHVNPDVVGIQAAYQEAIGPHAVVVIYDPLMTAGGSLALRAFRLCDEFMTAYREHTFTVSGLLGAFAGRIFEEVPIRIRNAPLVEAFMLDIERKGAVDCDSDRLDLAADPFFEKSLYLLTRHVEELTRKQTEALSTEHRLQKSRSAQQAWHARRKAENEARAAAGQALLPSEPEPGNPAFKPLYEAEGDRLEILLHSAQVASYCEAINSFAGKGFGKLFLAGSLHTEL